MNELNYAKTYADALAQAFPYTLHFGALYATPNNGRFRFRGGKTIEIPIITTSGRVDADRDTVGDTSRNYENAWESKTLGNQRKWSTLIHPQDIDQTDYAATIANITSVFNREHKFPEMDAYTVSKLYADWTAAGKNALRVTLTAENILATFDDLMADMSEARVPANGRILYVTPAVMKLLKGASALGRSLDVKTAGGEINRTVTMLDGVAVVEVPASLMKTAYDFTSGWLASEDAEQIGMLLIHPEAVITPVSYEFACLDEPSASTGGKYVYYEESFEDVFLLNRRTDGVAFVLGA
ncbi:MAG: capsid protein [Ruminococcaceae bacterium]|nr:capsid protein [Oscillospiraceae bacterium]